MIVLKRPKEIEKMKRSGQIVAEVLDAVEALVEPGISTWVLEQKAQELVDKYEVKPAFKGYKVGSNVFPACLCISINEEVVHGIPSKKRILKEGDIVSVDFGLQKDGYFGDSARTFPVGKVSDEAAKLLTVTKASLEKGIAQMLVANRLQDIGAAIQSHAEKNDFSIVRDFVGHGIGRNLHEEPQIPNYGTPGRGVRLRPGMVFAIEPMLNLGVPDVEILSDGWTVVTKDRKISAHFEHTVALTENGPLILTASSASFSTSFS